MQINSCPRCHLEDKTLSPLTIWKGCQRCRFGVKEYLQWKHEVIKQPHNAYNNYYKKIEVEILCLMK